MVKLIIVMSITKCALLAQLDRVTGYEPVGRGFESLPAYQFRKKAPDFFGNQVLF